MGAWFDEFRGIRLHPEGRRFESPITRQAGFKRSSPQGRSPPPVPGVLRSANVASADALNLNRDDVHAVELLVAHGRGVMSQQTEREIIDDGYGSFAGRERQLVLKVLPARRGDELQLDRRALRSRDDDQAGTLGGLCLFFTDWPTNRERSSAIPPA